MAQYQFPFSFHVVPRLSAQGKRKRGQLEPEGDPPAQGRLVVRRRIDDANNLAQTNTPGDQQIRNPVQAIEYQDAAEGVQSRQGSSSSSPPLVPPPQPPQNVYPGSAPLHASKPPSEAIAPPRTDEEPVPTLTEVNPESGSTTGGARIWLKGTDFPTQFPLFARFGTAIVPTVSPLTYMWHPLSLHFLDFQQSLPSFLHFAFRDLARQRQGYTIEEPTSKCTRLWDQYREVSILGRF